VSSIEPRRPGKWRALLDELEALGFHPSRTRGQNFLFDDSMLDAIVSDARLEDGDPVLEVGPGCGVLTERLAPRASEVLAVELDPRLAELTRRRLAEHANVHVVEGDALDGKHALNPTIVEWCARQPRWRLVANLPYSVGTPILVACSRLTTPPKSMTVLLQRELVDRIAAHPGDEHWGAVSAKLQAAYDVRRGRRVGPQMFWPRPSVESAVVRLDLLAARPGAEALARLDALATHLFAQRRKTLRSRLAELVGGRDAAQALCVSLSLDPEVRPERLTVSQLGALAERLHSGA
jgi:16S rRNA (adenine1518-N6/adenine1519-N6)-dimethyltransferase